MNTGHFVETKNLSYELGYTSHANLFTIQVSVLHHLSSVEITAETLSSDGYGKSRIQYYQRLIGKRLTLKYF
jgi:hypothetical protein